MFKETLSFNANLGATVIRADGSHRDIENLDNGTISLEDAAKKVNATLPTWKRIYRELRSSNLIPTILTFGAFVAWMKGADPTVMQSLVTTAGIQYLAADFLSSSSAHIGAFSYCDCGTGTTAAAIGDTALQTPAGTARTNGTQSIPTAGTFKVAGTINFTSTLAITEFGLFSASTSGTMWDHRIHSTITVNTGDSITYNYSCQCVAGGS